jgi:hypothetical protein
MTSTVHVGWSSELYLDPSLNFRLNRWTAYGGSRWFEDVRPVVSTSNEAWKDAFAASSGTFYWPSARWKTGRRSAHVRRPPVG